MATSLVKVNGTEVSVADSGKTVVNINITQESSLSYLIKAVMATGQMCRGRKEPTPKTTELSASAATPPSAQCTGEQKVLGGTQILLGVMCLGIGGVISLFHGYIPAIGTGAPFWMGSLFVLSGSLAVLSERRGGCWVLLATFFHLGSVVAGCVGLAEGVAYVPYLTNSRYWSKDWCNIYDSYPSWTATQSPTDDWRMDRCKEKMRSLLNVLGGVQILLLIFSVAAMVIALFCFGYGLRVLCCSRQANSEEYVAVGDVEVPPPYEKMTEEKMAD